jgi:hypothetical protein
VLRERWSGRVHGNNLDILMLFTSTAQASVTMCVIS